ncbi:DUF4129 domain protein [Natrialba magadii ATCC 43099]|uniref:DUF4129 domain protein n=1 Tax=Natrialba magadii (strain ATCC 43099 / DSM 3394 / CCM 3739 / CIP 104546 / IAM 13178 / JCM 8861 / NBRC 102185 / NCIMB 2190 / MS3) TaxID=547559 RepID=D3T0M6_NATMM|nr:DUF4129 domain-containing protein [Natrialba magadii]ADD06505.1 DUF4129 domain protein [Natrialba magadii ATCC 43099]ELY32033.1 hypothetical protein C500_05628 [Natrialba magadii ATCC 43099]
MSDARRILFVAGCLVCLLAVASALPAADPRLDAPGSEENVTTGSWDTLVDPFDPMAAVTNTSVTGGEGSSDTDTDTDSDSTETDEPTRAIELEGDPEPGSERTVTVEDTGAFTERTLTVNGEHAGETDHFGEATITVPYAEEMTIDVTETDQSRTFDIDTAAAIEHEPGAAPTRDLEIATAVGSTPVANGTVYIEDERVGTTAENGTATVPLPESAEPTTVRVERGPVTGTETIDVAEPTVEFASPLLLPGMPAPVHVSADGAGVPNASVSVASDGSGTTGSDGTTYVRLPFDDEATVTTTLGSETATATVDDLYLRLTAIVVIVPGFVLGGVLTYIRYIPSRQERRQQRLSGFFVGLAGAFSNLGSVVGGFAHSLRHASRPRFEWALLRPRLGISLSTLSRLVPSLPSTPPIGSTLSSLWTLRWGNSSDRDRRFRSILRRNDEETAEDTTADTDRTVASESGASHLGEKLLEPRSPQAEVRAIWHAVLDRLGVRNRETRTPGEVARDALDEGYPAVSMRRLVTIFRELEYGDREPSADQVLHARAAAANLVEYEPDESEETGAVTQTGGEDRDEDRMEGGE